MDEEVRIQIVKAMAIAGMWGNSGVMHVALDSMDKRIPFVPTWRDLYSQHAKEAKREEMGVIVAEEELICWLGRGYWLTNPDDDGCSLFNPSPMNGLAKYVSRDLADKYYRMR